MVEALATIGKEDMPDVLTQAAKEIQTDVCRVYGVATAKAGALHGELLGRLGQGVADPDSEAVRWVQEGTTPLGIKKPIIP